MRGYQDSTIQENLFTRWFAAGLGVIILSLGEFEVYFHFFSIAIAAIKFFSPVENSFLALTDESAYL